MQRHKQHHVVLVWKKLARYCPSLALTLDFDFDFDIDVDADADADCASTLSGKHMLFGRSLKPLHFKLD